MTASSWLRRKKPMDMTFISPIRIGITETVGGGKEGTGSRAPASWGMLGPWMSTVHQPRRAFPDSISDAARLTATVLLPTPPLPDMTTILCFMRHSRDWSCWRSWKSLSLSLPWRWEASQGISSCRRCRNSTELPGTHFLSFQQIKKWALLIFELARTAVGAHHRIRRWAARSWPRDLPPA